MSTREQRIEAARRDILRTATVIGIKRQALVGASAALQNARPRPVVRLRIIVRRKKP